MAHEFYEILELSPEASPEEIKRGYYRLIRKYPPEKYPEQFKQIREAYDTLSDPKTRQNYDSLQQYGDEIQNLFDQVQQKMQAEEWSSAIPLLKRIIVLAPSLSVAQNKLGICFTHQEQWDAAAKVYSKLTKDNPEVAIYWCNFGHVYKEQASSLDNTDNKPVLYHKARECFKKAIELESINSEHYIDVAQTYLDEKNYYEAVAWAERAIGADGKADFDDFDTLFFICLVYFRSDDLENIEATAKRIISLLPDSEDARRYAAYKFYNLGLDIVKVGIDQVNFDLLKAAFSFIKAARDFDPSDADIKDIHEKIEEAVLAIKQYEILEKDSLIIEGFKKMATFVIANYFNVYEDEKAHEIGYAIIDEISSYSKTDVISSLKRIKSYYPNVYALHQSLFDSFDEASLKSDTKQSNNSMSPTPTQINNQASTTQTQNNNKTVVTPQATYQNSSGSNDWRNAVIIGGIIGGAIIVGFALNRNPQVLQMGEPGNPTPTPLSTSSAPSLSQEDAKNLLFRWQGAKREIFAPPYNRQLAAQLITGKLYDETLSSEGSIAWLETNGAYYQYGVQKIDSVERFAADGNEATIEAIITEERTLYNQKGGADKKNSNFDTRLVRYSLTLENGQWKIAAYKTVRTISKS